MEHNKGSQCQYDRVEAEFYKENLFHHSLFRSLFRFHYFYCQIVGKILLDPAIYFHEISPPARCPWNRIPPYFRPGIPLMAAISCHLKKNIEAPIHAVPGNCIAPALDHELIAQVPEPGLNKAVRRRLRR
jgi:hypothetical protein